MKFVMTSTNKENMEYGLKYRIWQTKRNFYELNPGDVGFIKVSGNDKMHCMGIIDSISLEPVLQWPISDVEPEEQFTIRFRESVNSDYKDSPTAIKYENVHNPGQNNETIN